MNSDKPDVAGRVVSAHLASQGVTTSKLLKVPQVSNPFGNSGQMVHLPKGLVSVDEFISEQKDLAAWLKIKNIVEAHQIIEEWPDGDIVIRIKRNREAVTELQGTKPDASEYRVDFGVDDKEDRK